ncbi:MAG: tetratricopeptide repeat protein [Anderseniella sp.]|jgi:tetratricopeptide (TPR) repeat protein|nr:tetratricopeptide repeat protein [Anderseniella sp.]
MALQDGYGNAISTHSSEALDHYNTGLRLFLGANFGAVEAFEASVTEDPGFALGHAGLARAQMSAGRVAEAKAANEQAKALAASATQRERDHIGTIALLLSGEAAKACQAVRAHVLEHPRDAMVAQLCTSVFGLIGFSGEVAHEAELLAFTDALMPHYGEDWWMMSMHAISLCETGQIAASQRLMEKALALNPRNANGAHFKAHAEYEAGETAAGRQYLAEWLQDYDDRAVLHGHLSWHLALWALHAGDEETMWATLDSLVGPDASKGLPINILTDTVAILHRASIAGFTVDSQRWKAISDYAVKYFPETGQSFADIHAALSHAMAGEGERLARIAEAAKGFAGDLVRPVARAFEGIARGNWSAALDELTPVLASADRLGGSRAQRDLIELTYVHTLMKLGLADEARRTLLSRRPVLAKAPPVAGLH